MIEKIRTKTSFCVFFFGGGGGVGVVIFVSAQKEESFWHVAFILEQAHFSEVYLLADLSLIFKNLHYAKSQANCRLCLGKQKLSFVSDLTKKLKTKKATGKLSALSQHIHFQAKK